MRSQQWLLELKGHVIRTTTQAAAQYWPSPNPDGAPYYNFRLEHTRQVERDALFLSNVEQGDDDIILASVWIHDRFQEQFSGAQHADKAGRWTRSSLALLGFPKHKVEAVARAVELHTRRSMDIPKELPDARILWDADHLSRLGPVNIINYTLCHLAKDFLAELPNNSQFRSGAMSIRDFAPLLMERRNALFKADWFYFDESRSIARKRISVMRDFLDVLENQIY